VETGLGGGMDGKQKETMLLKAFLKKFKYNA